MIRVDADTREAERILDQLAAAGKTAAVARRMGQAAEGLIREGFRDERSPWGEAWEPLAPSTLAARRRKGRAGTSILVDEGRMFASLRSRLDGETAVVSIAGDERFPAVHQFGDNGLPARAMFPVREAGTEIPSNWWPVLVAPLEAAIREASR